ncbi:MAG: cyclic nucleotide-binding domain-containing protein [Chloroflexi bacterium]|nr:cyclic nucleotide-binding domain-containing protein [Chloroflexota bacterium]
MTTPLDLFRNVPLFADLPEHDLQSICESSEERILTPGEVLFEEGAEGNRAYLIVEGEADIVKTSGGKELLLSVLGPGKVIGEMALIEDTPRTATVRAKSDLKLMVIQKELLEQLLETSLSATRAIFNTMLARWRGTQACWTSATLGHFR